MALIPGQQYTPAQIYAEDPQWLQKNAPQLYSTYAQQVTTPQLDIQGKQIQNTVAGSTATADVNLKNTQANVQQQTQTPQIESAFAGAEQEKQKAAQVKAVQDSQAIFEKSKGADRHVSPDVYNTQLEQAVKTGINPEDFAKQFSNYLNPNNVWYNTPDANAIRQNLPDLAAVVKSYASLDQAGQAGPELQKYKNIPGVGDILYQHLAPDALAHDQLKTQVAAKALKPAGAGQGSTVRGSVTELGYATSLLPDAKDTRAVANAKIAKLDQYLKDNYSTTLDNWLGASQ